MNKDEKDKLSLWIRLFKEQGPTSNGYDSSYAVVGEYNSGNIEQLLRFFNTDKSKRQFLLKLETDSKKRIEFISKEIPRLKSEMEKLQENLKEIDRLREY